MRPPFGSGRDPSDRIQTFEHETIWWNSQNNHVISNKGLDNSPFSWDEEEHAL
jgi:hypothetical protein